MTTKILAEGAGEFIPPDPDAARKWMYEKKSRELKSKVMDEHEAVSKFVSDGFYLSYDLSSMVRGPMALEREFGRQNRKSLWIAARVTLLDPKTGKTEMIEGPWMDGPEFKETEARAFWEPVYRCFF